MCCSVRGTSSSDRDTGSLDVFSSTYTPTETDTYLVHNGIVWYIPHVQLSVTVPLPTPEWLLHGGGGGGGEGERESRVKFRKWRLGEQSECRKYFVHVTPENLGGGVGVGGGGGGKRLKGGSSHLPHLVQPVDVMIYSNLRGIVRRIISM